jgi:hypothetical protein
LTIRPFHTGTLPHPASMNSSAHGRRAPRAKLGVPDSAYGGDGSEERLDIRNRFTEGAVSLPL